MHFATGLMSYPPMAFTSATPGYYFDELHYLSRRPRPLPLYGNLIRPFSPGVWIGIFCSLASLSLVFSLAYWVYDSGLAGAGELLETDKKRPWSEFVLFTFFKRAEPEPVLWFRKGIGGGVKK